MPFYQADIDATSVYAIQTWQVEASSPEEAREKFKRGSGVIVAEEVEILDLNTDGLRASDFHEVDAEEEAL